MEPIRFAVIGAGNIGKVHLQAIESIAEARATVVCNRTRASGRALAGEFGIDWEADYNVAVRRADVDVVAICTPSGTHLEIAVAAAQAGKHILAEKPLDITLERVDGIIEAARAADVKLACIFPRRFALGARTAKDAVAAGRLGRLTLADAYVKWHRPQEYYDVGWRGTWELDGGGALMNQSIHYIDLLQWLAGPVESVYGRTATRTHEMETEDTATAVVCFQNGAMGAIQGATSCWPGDEARVEVRGEKGVIALEEGRIVRWEMADAEAGEEERMLRLESALGSGAADPTAIGFDLHRRQIVDLIEAIRDDRPPTVAGAEGRHAVEIIRAIYRSAELGAPVSLPLEL